jgi:hypothetical protein
MEAARRKSSLRLDGRITVRRESLPEEDTFTEVGLLDRSTVGAKCWMLGGNATFEIKYCDDTPEDDMALRFEAKSGESGGEGAEGTAVALSSLSILIRLSLSFAIWRRDSSSS